MPLKLFNLGEAWTQPAVGSVFASSDVVKTEDINEADAFICWGLRPPHESVVEWLNESGRPVIIMDSGYLKRPPYDRDVSPDDYFAMNLAKIVHPFPAASALRKVKGEDFCSRRRLGFLGFLHLIAEHGGETACVILGQTAADRSHRIPTYGEMAAAYRSMVPQRMPAFFRPHPQDQTPAEKWMEMTGVVGVLDKSAPLLEQLEKIGGPGRVSVSTICSNAGLIAKLAGYRVVSSAAWYGSMHVDDAFGYACDSQFNCEELTAFGSELIREMITKP